MAADMVQAKPEAVRAQIVDGQLKKWFSEVVLVEQPFRDQDRTVGELIVETIAKTGENIKVRRFVRFELGRRCERGQSGQSHVRRRRRVESVDGDATRPRYRRILLKLSGEALLGFAVRRRSELLRIHRGPGREVHRLGVEIGIVVGGGNIFRGLAAAAKGMDRATGDYIGMLATVMNALALQDALEKARFLDASHERHRDERGLREPYIRRAPVRHLEKGE